MTIEIVKATLHEGTETASNSGDGQNCKAETGAVYLSVSDLTSTETLDVSVEEQDQISKQWNTIATFTQVTTFGTTEKQPITGFFGGNLRAVWVLSGPAATFTVSFAGKA